MAQETQGDKKPANKPGLYRQDESGAELTALSSVQADAFVRLGYHYVEDAPKPNTKVTKDKE